MQISPIDCLRGLDGWKVGRALRRPGLRLRGRRKPERARGARRAPPRAGGACRLARVRGRPASGECADAVAASVFAACDFLHYME